MIIRFNKAELLQELLSLLETEIVTLRLALDSTTDAATNSESKPENKYDTRALEASYLAGAQAERLAKLKDTQIRLQQMHLRSFTSESSAALTAIVTLAAGDELQRYWLLPYAAGYTLLAAGIPIQTITATAPVARSVIGRKVGESIIIGQGRSERDFELIQID